MLLVADIVSTLQQHCSVQAPPGWPIVYPGVAGDATRLLRWCEFWMTSVDDRVRRDQHRDSLWILVDLHCFSRDPATREIDRAADHFRISLSRTCLPIQSSTSPGVTGLLRFQEAVIREIPPRSDAEPRLPLRHLVLSTSGVAEEMGD